MYYYSKSPAVSKFGLSLVPINPSTFNRVYIDPLIIMGDFNAKVGQRGDEHSVGMHGTGNRNERGERLVEWCEMNNFPIGNTCFQQPQRRKWTWKSPGDNTRNQIDYILISGRFKNALLSAKSYPGADCYSDHALVLAKFRLKLKRTRKSQ